MKTEPEETPQPQCTESPVRRSNIFFGAVYSAGGASVTASSPGGEITEEEKGATAGVLGATKEYAEESQDTRPRNDKTAKFGAFDMPLVQNSSKPVAWR